MSSADTQFSKVRLEMLCDGIFAIAMTLLVLELKPPDLPRPAASADILHALREHGLAFVGLVLSFLLAGQFWIVHQPLTFAVAIGVVLIAPGQAMFAAAATQVLIAVVSKRVTARR